MVQPTLLEKLEQLPDALQTEILHYVEFLLEKYVDQFLLKAPVRKRKAGLLKGKIFMTDDFDAPLEDFQDYM